MITKTILKRTASLIQNRQLCSKKRKSIRKLLKSCQPSQNSKMAKMMTLKVSMKTLSQRIIALFTMVLHQSKNTVAIRLRLIKRKNSKKSSKTISFPIQKPRKLTPTTTISTMIWMMTLLTTIKSGWVSKKKWELTYF